MPNIPTEMHPLLAQAAAVNLLESLADTEALRNAEARMEKMVAAARTPGFAWRKIAQCQEKGQKNRTIALA